MAAIPREHCIATTCHTCFALLPGSTCLLCLSALCLYSCALTIVSQMASMMLDHCVCSVICLRSAACNYCRASRAICLRQMPSASS